MLSSLIIDLGMGRNIGTSGARVPSDPLWIDIPRSDGDQRWWPTNTTYIEDGGEINWMKVVDLDDDVALRWRLGVGNKISLDRSPEGGVCSYACPSGYDLMFRLRRGSLPGHPEGVACRLPNV